MRALILNSGMGTRMGKITNQKPKSMMKLNDNETILSRQLNILQQCGIKDIVMTTGFFDEILINYCHSLGLDLNYIFVKNPLYNKTNYIYSIYLARQYLHDDIILMHGDLVFEKSIFNDALMCSNSCMMVSSTIPLSPKDFKAVVNNGIINKVGIEFIDSAVTAQPLYKLNFKDWMVWLEEIVLYCERGQTSCYAENAFNEVSPRCNIHPFDYKDKLCEEVDTEEDLLLVREKLILIERGYYNE